MILGREKRFMEVANVTFLQFNIFHKVDKHLNNMLNQYMIYKVNTEQIQFNLIN